MQTNKPKILVTHAVFPDVIARLQSHFDVDVNDSGEPLSEADLIRRGADKDGLLVVGDRIPAALVEQAPRMKALANMAVGYNNLPLDVMTPRGIIGTNTPDVLNETTADLGWALLMATARRITEAEHFLRAGKWQSWHYDMLTGVDIYGATLGVVGMGRIGQAVARRAQGFGMRVIYHNRSRVAPEIEQTLQAEWVDRDTLLQRADHVVLVLPYTPQVHHLIGARELQLMKPTATLVNIARGGIIDDAALVTALQEKRIAGAGLDVFEGEPALHPGFLELSNVVLTPHIGSASIPTRRAMANLAADNLIAALGLGPNAGNPPNVVNPDARRNGAASGAAAT